ncbi:MAG: XylR family transcriptional regulator [Pirellulales bacterium]|nr:XylR family transcriptional regulator [Pirellulales bacterium]
MRRPRRIALLMSQDAGFHRQVLLGIRAYAGHSKRWVFHNAPLTQASFRPLAEWNPHGIIAHLDDPKLARMILTLKKPTIDTACVLDNLDVPVADVDHVAVGRLAAEHFLARGYRHFGFFGSGRARYALLRHESFRRTVEDAGFVVHSCHMEYLPRLPEKASWKNVNSEVRRWLKSLPKPAAVLADHDVPGRDLANMCQLLDLRVPNDVAILGVDNDEVECLLASPPLSSVAIPAERIGFEAAKLLERMMAGRKAPKRMLTLPPTRVVTRQSTSMFAVDDPVVSGALLYIRNHLDKPLNVNMLTEELVVSRRALEKKFRELLGRTVLQEIHRARIERAQELLGGNLQVAEVAHQTGFSSPQLFATVFRRLTGVSPRQYRHENRLGKQG